MHVTGLLFFNADEISRNIRMTRLESRISAAIFVFAGRISPPIW